MGFRIDKFALTVLLAGALYVFFMGAMRSIPVAAAGAFISMAILKKLSQKIPTDRIGRKRRAYAKARSELEELALSDQDAAEKRIQEVLRKAYSDSINDVSIHVILCHPSCGQLTGDDICAAWRRHNGDSKLLIVTTGKADAAVRQLTKRLNSPRTELIDGQLLTGLLAECGPSPQGMLGQPPRKSSRLSAAARAAGRTNTGKCAFTGIMMFLIFWFTGTAVYLIGALMLAFIAGMSFRKRCAPRELFSS